MIDSHKNRFSIVIAVYDDAQLLDEHLPLFLGQNFENGYEVIVVDESSTDDTPDVLKRFKLNNPHLYTTFLPQYHFQKDRRRISLTIGSKAAKNEWIIMTNIDFCPPSENWLQELFDNIEPNDELLLGYIRKKAGDVRLKHYDSVDEASSTISTVVKHRSRLFRLSFRNQDYDFIVVQSSKVHDLLRLFETNKIRRL
jgi:glycosyltransferase involved in cell wall biosynthesis